jgi:hypothetical protein
MTKKECNLGQLPIRIGIMSQLPGMLGEFALTLVLFMQLEPLVLSGLSRMVPQRIPHNIPGKGEIIP